MKKPAKIVDEILRVDPQAGHLRLALFLILAFIVWSLLALIASIHNPFPSLNTLWIFQSTESTSLASDLWQDIFSNYFSVFALINLALILLLGAVSFRSAARVMQDALHLTDIRTAEKYLRACAFSFPPYAEISLPEIGVQKSDSFKILKALGGPCRLTLDEEQAAIVQHQHSSLQVRYPSPDEENSLFIPHQEKLIGLIPTGMVHTHISLDALSRDGQRLNLKNMRVTYSHLLRTSTFPDPDQAAPLDIGIMPGGSGQEEFINESLQLEIRTFLMGYSSVEIQQMYGLEDELDAQPTQILPASNRSHSTPPHKQFYLTPSRFFQWQKQAGFLRHRRRSILPELHAYPVIEREPEPLAPNINEILTDYLNKIFKSIYNNKIINIEIENIGEVKFNGEY